MRVCECWSKWPRNKGCLCHERRAEVKISARRLSLRFGCGSRHPKIVTAGAFSAIINKGQIQFIVSFWRKSDGGFRWLLIAVLGCILLSVTDLLGHGPNDIRWIEPLFLAVGFWALLPFHEPPLRSLPWHRKLRKPRALLGLFVLAIALIVRGYGPH